MAPVGTVVPGRRGATPTVPRVGGTGMEAPVSRPGGSTRQSSPAVPWGDDRSTAGDGCPRTLPRHLGREPILPHGGMLLFEMARVLPHPGSEGYDGR